MPKTLWNPEYLSNKVLWLKASDLVGTVADGAEVTMWSDKSGNAYHATGTAGSAPTLDLDGFNGRPTLAFDGTESLSTASIGTSGDFSVFVVAGDNSSSASNAYAINSTNLQLRLRNGGVNIAVMLFRDSAAGLVYLLNPGVSSASGAIYSSILDGGVSNTLIRNGTLLDATSSGGVFDGTNTVLDPMSFGSSLIGDIAEIIIVNAALSDADRQKVEGYLAHDFGLASQLPTTHLYRNEPPSIETSGIVKGAFILANGCGWRPDVPVILAISTSHAVSDAISTQIVTLRPTVDCWIEFDSTPTAAVGSSIFIPANRAETFMISAGQKIGAIAGSSGKLNIVPSRETT